MGLMGTGAPMCIHVCTHANKKLLPVVGAAERFGVADFVGDEQGMAPIAAAPVTIRN